VTSFSELGLAETLLRALEREGYTTPTPIQAQAIPHLLEGRDLLGIAQTGTGKTAAFALPILQRLAEGRRAPPKHCRALILAPTRELAAQIGESFRAYGSQQKLSVAVVVGGVSMGAQVRALARGVDVLVATPGRLLDHVQSRSATLDGVEVVVLDEADHMLDLGFIVPIRKILKLLPIKRQSLFFSATMPKAIGELAGDMLREPVQVQVTPVATTAEKVRQEVHHVPGAQKRAKLAELLSHPDCRRSIVFTRTKHGADKVAHYLAEAGLPAVAIHGNKSQSQRERALDAFRSGQAPILVATDIAARGIDVDGVTHVVNFELPNVPEQYVHRIGRTARAGNGGVAISLCDPSERSFLRDIEKLTRQAVTVIGDLPAGPAGHSPRPKPQGRRDDMRGRTEERGRNQRRGRDGRTQDERQRDARSQESRDARSQQPRDARGHDERPREEARRDTARTPSVRAASPRGEDRPQRRFEQDPSAQSGLERMLRNVGRVKSFQGAGGR
jgi:ATP-dependent RNA helicase RhlE